MQLNEYEWSGNPRGLHNEGAYKPIVRDRYPRLQLGWYKFVTGGEEFAPDCAWLLSNNITPVIRIYRQSPGAAPMNASMRNQWGIYRDVGVKWFEFYNEPNLRNPEWGDAPQGGISSTNTEGVIKPLCENWLDFAEYIIGIGGYPGFTSFSETVGVDGGLQWQDAMLKFIRDHHMDRFQKIIQNGMWAAVHPYTLNHFYQEVPGQPGTPRLPEQYNAEEPGWHFEYPYDPYTQAYDPGRTVWGGTPKTPYGDPNGLTAMGIAFQQRLKEWFGADPVPAVGTEGGIYPLPIHESQRTDPRFPAYDRNQHAEATVALFNWMATSGPEWLFGVCLWKEDEYFNNGLPAVQRLEAVQQIPRGGVWVSRGRGPGPVHGDPTFHMVVLAPGLETSWFFETARSYWNTFRPIVTSSWDFIDYIPYEQSLAVTVITPPDMAASMSEAIQRKYPNVLFDLVITNGDQTGIADVFNNRVWSNRRFG